MLDMLYHLKIGDNNTNKVKDNEEEKNLKEIEKLMQN